MSNIIDMIIWNFDIIRQVIAAIAIGPLMYIMFHDMIKMAIRKLNTKTNKEAA